MVDTEVSPQDDSQLRVRLDYDTAISRGVDPGATSDIPIAPSLAKTIRLLHDVLGPPATQLPSHYQSHLPGQSLVAGSRGVCWPGSPDARLPSSADRPDWSLPLPFGRFEVLHRLGQGSFGAVWKAYDPVLKRFVAIKALHPELRVVAMLQERFEKEAQAAARLNHPNIVRVHEVGAIDGVIYLVTEFVDGAALKAVRNGALAYSCRAAASIVAQLADAAHHSHLHGVLHRDIKPENVLVESLTDDQGNVTTLPRLTDFGLARIVDQQTNASTFGMIVGSLDYMAPEQMMGLADQVGPRSDIYSLGVILYQLLAGRLPRRSDGNVFQVLEASQAIPDLRTTVPDIPRDLAAICARCLAFDPRDRFATALALRNDLENFLEGKPTQTRPPSLPERLLRWTRVNRLAAIALGMVATSILAALMVSAIAAYQLSMRNAELTIARNASLKSQQESIRHEARFRRLAWDSGLQLAFGKLERGKLSETVAALGSLSDQYEDAAKRPAWQLLKAELASQYHPLLKEPVPLREIVPIQNTSLLAIAGDQSSIILFDQATRTTVKRIATGIGEIHALAASPDGKRLAAGGSPRPDIDLALPVIIDWSTGAVSELPVSGPTNIESLAFSPDGKRLAVGFRYEDVRVVELDSPGSAVVSLPASRRARAVGWRTLDGPANYEVLVHQTHPLVVLHDLEGRSSESIDLSQSIETFAVSQDGNWLVASIADQRRGIAVSMRDPSRRRIELTQAQGVAKALAISPDGKWVAAGFDRGEVVIWELPETAETAEPADACAAVTRPPIEPYIRKTILNGGVTSVAWSQGSLVVVGESGEAVEWSPLASQEPFAGDALITAAGFVAPDVVAIGSFNGEVNLSGVSDLVSGPSNNLSGHPGLITPIRSNAQANVPVNSLSLAADRYLLASHADGTIRQLRSDDLQVVASFDTDQQRNHVISNMVSRLSDDSLWLASGGHDNRLRLLNRETGEIPLAIDFPGDVDAIRFLGDEYLAVGGQFEGARIFDLKTLRSVASLGTAHVGDIHFDRLNRVVTIGFNDGFVRSWAIGSWEARAVLKVSDFFILSITQTPDGSLGICVDERSNVIAYNPQQQIVLGRLREGIPNRERFSHSRSVCQFSPDGEKLLLLLVFFADVTPSSVLQLYDLSPSLGPPLAAR
jgi:serine/threonine protein kinase/WD40 repeat protein